MWNELFLGFIFLLLIKLVFMSSLHQFLFSVFMISLLASVKMYCQVKSWLAAVFLLLYAGGLLMLFFYLLSLAAKQYEVTEFSGFYILLIFMFMLFMLKYSFLKSEFSVNLNYSDYFMQDKFFNMMMLLLAGLLMVLWSVKKLTLKTSGPLRPWF